jgi:hypothetical protein
MQGPLIAGCPIDPPEFPPEKDASFDGYVRAYVGQVTL